MLADQTWGRDQDGGWGTHWDPRFPHIVLEQPFFLTPPPPKPATSTVTSKRWRDKNGNPLPLPAREYPPIEGTVRPDVVILKDPTKPPTPDNIKKVYDVKFPGDRWRPGQRDAYTAITNHPPGEISLDECEHCQADELPDPPPYPVPEDKRQEEDEPDEGDEPEDEEPEQPDLPLHDPIPDPSPIALLLLMLMRMAEGLARGLQPVTPGFPPLLPKLPGDAEET